MKKYGVTEVEPTVKQAEEKKNEDTSLDNLVKKVSKKLKERAPRGNK